MFLVVALTLVAVLSGCGDTRRSEGLDSGADDAARIDARPGLDAARPDGATSPTGRDPEVWERTGRAQPERCDGFRETTELGMRSCGCASDAECGDGDNGRCSIDHDVRRCTYDECSGDADCATGTACACNVGPDHNDQCVTAKCITDSDCAGFACGLSRNCGGGSGRVGPPDAFRCHTVLDECLKDADCGDPTKFCRWGGPSPTGGWVDDRWMCNPGCSVGAPICP